MSSAAARTWQHDGRSRVSGPPGARGRSGASSTRFRAPTEAQLQQLPWYRELTQAQRTIARGFARTLARQGWVQIKYQALAAGALVSRPTAIKAVKALVAVGWIEQHRAYNRNGGDAARIYRAGEALLQLFRGQENDSPFPVGGNSAVSLSSSLSDTSNIEVGTARDRRNPAPRGAGTVSLVRGEARQAPAGPRSAPPSKRSQRRPQSPAERLRDSTTAALGGAVALRKLWRKSGDPATAAIEQRTLVKLCNLAERQQLGTALVRLAAELSREGWATRPVSVLRLRYAKAARGMGRDVPAAWLEALQRQERAAAAAERNAPDRPRRPAEPVRVADVVNLDSFRSSRSTGGGDSPPAAAAPAAPAAPAEPPPADPDAAAAFLAELQGWKRDRTNPRGNP